MNLMIYHPKGQTQKVVQKGLAAVSDKSMRESAATSGHQPATHARKQFYSRASSRSSSYVAQEMMRQGAKFSKFPRANGTAAL